MWEKLDEVLGAGILGSLAALSLYLNADATIAPACVAGIVALLSVKAAKN